MDDVTLGGPEAQVARDVETVRIKGEEIGLYLNERKCKFISNAAQSSETVFRNFLHVTPNNAELLGAPLTADTAMDRALNSRCDDLSRAASRLSLVAAHDALVTQGIFQRPQTHAHAKILPLFRSPSAGQV